MSVLLRHPLSQDMLCRRPGRFPVAQKADRTVDGILFDSKKEATRYAELKLLQRAGEISNLETQVAMKVFLRGQPYCTFTVDFCYREAAGKLVYEEVKSSGTAKDDAYRLRRKAAEIYHGVEITEVIR